MKKILAAAVIAAAAVVGAGIAAPAFAALQPGAAAPEITAKGVTKGEEFAFKLSEALKKGPVVMYFFPAAFTAGCTVETQMFSEKIGEFEAAGATLFGLTAGAALEGGGMINTTTGDQAVFMKRLAEFSKQHCSDKFPMVAITADTMKAYDVVLTGRPDWSNRTSFVIAPDSKILLSHTDMAAASHIEKTLAAVKAYKASHGAHGAHSGH